jgi:uncharacterized membrane protein
MDRFVSRATWPAAVSLTVIAAVGYAVASVRRHERFGSNAYDLGIYDQTVWGYSRFDVGVPNTVLRTPTLLIDHFQPVLFALAPAYWLWTDVRMLLVLQAMLVASASLPLFAFALDRLGAAPALLLQTAYLVFFGVIGGILYDFHEVAVAAPLVSLALFALLTKRTTMLLVALALLLLTKESLALTVAAFGLYLAFVQRRWLFGGAVAAFALVWFIVVFEVVLPRQTDAEYANWFYPALGDTPGEALRHIIRHPIDTVQLLFTPEAKARGLFNLFAPWLFLPLLSPLVLVMLPTIAERFLADKPAFWAQGFHYSLVLAPMLAFAATDAVARLARLVPRVRATAAVAATAAIVLAGAFFTFVRLEPLAELDRLPAASYARTIETCLETIPDGASVAATSALVPHLSHRRRIYQLDRRPLPATDYYAIDVYTWMFPLTVRDVDRLVTRLRSNGYGVRCSRRGIVVLARGSSPSTALSAELQRLIGRA